MINTHIYLTFFLLVGSKGCETVVNDREIDMSQSVVVEADTPYANVFQALDGTWNGTFLIFEDPNGQQAGTIQPDQVNRSFLDGLDLKQTGTVSVKQTYTSNSPYHQAVKIEDTYLEDGTQKTVSSYGVNKIENGVMWCIVEKPDETVIHRGSMDGEHTIIWGRSKFDPLKIEYFRETVLTDTYEIIGYGYYGNDDPKLTPKTWFHGSYKRS